VLFRSVDVASVGLSVLRSSVSIIPHDPVLFSGTVRSNLDPHGVYSDDELWLALTKAHLLSTVRSLPAGLSFVVSEGGDNFSSGQKQLLCLARALVRRSRLLLLDEATSSVDTDTDELIQRTIRDEFGARGCTVLTIAHRLRTILDADKVLVMDEGRVAEFAAPAVLLANATSIFARLVATERLQSNSSVGIVGVGVGAVDARGASASMYAVPTTATGPALGAITTSTSAGIGSSTTTAAYSRGSVAVPPSVSS